jgi:hypothetical protein
MDKLTRLSASKLKLYQRCPTAYAHRYIAGKESLGIHALMGSAVHKAIEKYYSTGADTIQTFQDSFSKWITPEVDNLQIAMSLFHLGREMVTTFDPSLYAPKIVDGKLQLERYFKLPYPNAERPICTLEGYIDVVTDTQVVDFKTGKDIVSRKKVENDLQFIIYYWAHKELYGYYPEEIVYHRLRDQRQIKGKEFIFTELDTIIHQFLNDPMTYEPIPCDQCPVWCTVRKAQTHVIT